MEWNGSILHDQARSEGDDVRNSAYISKVSRKGEYIIREGMEQMKIQAR